MKWKHLLRPELWNIMPGQIVLYDNNTKVYIGAITNKNKPN